MNTTWLRVTKTNIIKLVPICPSWQIKQNKESSTKKLTFLTTSLQTFNYTDKEMIKDLIPPSLLFFF